MELFLAYLDQFRYMAGNLTIMVMLCHRSLSHRPDYRRRVLLGGLVCMALAFAYVPLQSVLRPVFVRTPIVIGPYWLLMSFVPVGFVLFCYETGFAGALFRVMMGAFTENIATVLIRNLFVYALFPDFPERRPVLYVLFMIVFYVLFYRAASITLGRRIRSDEMARLTDDRAAALLFLFTYLAYTAIMSTSKYVSEVLIVPLQAGAGFTGIYRFLQLFLVGVMLLLSVMMTAMMWYIYDRMALKAEKEVIARLAQERKAQYEFSRENIEMINRKTHDLKHQLQALALVTDEERKHQIEEASRAVDFYDAIVKTGNEALDWAEKYGLKVLLDLHTVPHSQNGYDNGGITGVCKWRHYPEEVEFALTVLERMAERYGNRPGLYGIEVLNEPISWIVYITAPSTGKATDKEEAKGSGYVPLPFLRDFYTQAYQRIRKYLPEEKTIVFHDGFRCTAWNKFFREAKFKNVALDTHIYIFAMENFVPIAKPWVYKIYLNACMMQVRKAQKDIPVIVGEWCICNKYANKMDQSVMSQIERAEKQKARYRKIAKMELDAWKETAGWFYWNYQLLRDCNKPTDESWKESWDLSRCLKNGWLTKEDFVQ